MLVAINTNDYAEYRRDQLSMHEQPEAPELWARLTLIEKAAERGLRLTGEVIHMDNLALMMVE